jgi:hypothetical protein
MSIHRTQSTILPWQKKSNPSHPLLERLNTMTSELELIQNELCGLMGASDGTPKKRGSLPETAGADVMRFKAAVDQLRRTLWFYCDEEAQELLHARGPSVSHSLTPQVQPGTSAAEVAIDQGGGSFFDRLNLVIDGYIQSNGSISRSTRKIKI